MRCYNAQLPLIKEDWILVIDIDEFLYLNTFPDIHEFLRTFGDDVGQVQFPWVNVMSYGYCHDRVLDILGDSRKYVSDHVKSMARREFTGGFGIHAHGVGQASNCLSSGLAVPCRARHSFLFDESRYCEMHPFVLHFCSRGHFDTLNRVIDHQFFNSKNGQLEKNRLARFLLNNPDLSNVPTRYLLMTFYLSLPTTDVRCSVPEISARSDVPDLKRIFLTNIGKIVDFSCPDPGNIEAWFEECFQFSRKLESQNSRDMFKLDDYLKCASQLEYIDKLRKASTTGNEAQ